MIAALSLAAALAAGPAEVPKLQQARAFIEKHVNEALEQLKNKKLDQNARRKRVVEISERMFDLPLMAKLSLGRAHWGKLDEAQRKRFTELFVAQLKASYAEKVDLLTDEKVEFEEPVEKSPGKYEMPTAVVAKDKRYKMLYKLYLRDGSPVAYDVEIDGISVVRSYGAQYDQFLADKGVEELLARMAGQGLGEPAELKDKQKELGKKEPVPGAKKETGKGG